MKNKICGIILTLSLVCTLIPITSIDSAAAGDPLVIVLDAGHGGKDSGAVSNNGIKEKDVNLKIVKYMQAQLDEYYGVEVEMTRSTDVFYEISERADIAKDYNADLFISIHANSSESSSAKGAETYYPNKNFVTNYNTSVSYTQIKELAQACQDGLVDLGLYDRGILIRNAVDDKYEDGSTADYYGVIRYNKMHGIPAILIEHGYLSNSSDVSNYLNSDTKLKKLATANVESIVQTLGLSKVGAEITITAPTKTEYIVGEELDITGLTVNAEYEDGTVATLSDSDYTITGYDSSKAGNRVLTVSYWGSSAKFIVCILPEGADTNSTLIGDVNGDGAIKANDYLIIKDSFLEGIVLSSAQFARADVKEDGVIKANDYLMIKDYFLGKLEYLRDPEESKEPDIAEESDESAEKEVLEESSELTEPDGSVESDESAEPNVETKTEDGVESGATAEFKDSEADFDENISIDDIDIDEINETEH